MKGPANETNSIWVINSDGSNLKKLAENASSPKWTLIPRITFISQGTAKIIILTVIGLTGILLLFGMALITRRAVKAAAAKPKPESKVSAGGDFCTNCGTQNPESASFCKKCGQRLQ